MRFDRFNKQALRSGHLTCAGWNGDSHFWKRKIRDWLRCASDCVATRLEAGPDVLIERTLIVISLHIFSRMCHLRQRNWTDHFMVSTCLWEGSLDRLVIAERYCWAGAGGHRTCDGVLHPGIESCKWLTIIDPAFLTSHNGLRWWPQVLGHWA